MATIGDNYSIETNRGSMLALTIKAKDKDDNFYEFQPDDVIRFRLMTKGNCDDVILQEDVVVSEVSESVPLVISSEKMKIGEIINKPVTYWYEIELNPDTSSTITILGYTKKTGARILTLTPEGGDKK